MKNHLKPRDLACCVNMTKTNFKKRSNFFFVLKKLYFFLKSPILGGLCISFKTCHFFMWIQFMCVDCYIGKFTLSNIILYKRAIRWTLVASQAETRKDECMIGAVAYEWNLIVINYWREIYTLIHPWVWSPNKTFQYNTRAK